MARFQRDAGIEAGKQGMRRQASCARQAALEEMTDLGMAVLAAGPKLEA